MHRKSADLVHRKLSMTGDRAQMFDKLVFVRTRAKEDS